MFLIVSVCFNLRSTLGILGCLSVRNGLGILNILSSHNIPSSLSILNSLGILRILIIVGNHIAIKQIRNGLVVVVDVVQVAIVVVIVHVVGITCKGCRHCCAKAIVSANCCAFVVVVQVVVVVVVIDLVVSDFGRAVKTYQPTGTTSMGAGCPGGMRFPWSWPQR